MNGTGKLWISIVGLVVTLVVLVLSAGQWKGQVKEKLQQHEKQDDAQDVTLYKHGEEINDLKVFVAEQRVHNAATVEKFDRVLTGIEKINEKLDK